MSCTAIIVDDGIATGATVRAALRAVRRRNPARLVLAVPVAPPDTLKALGAEVDEIVCVRRPMFLGSIGAYGCELCTGRRRHGDPHAQRGASSGQG